tara:strand:+ start:11622 stop:12287 length:666 start_codon:yes stop_codon:yes gene_type:complete
MAKFYVPKEKEEYLAPFGPVMGYKAMSDSFIKNMNKAMNPELEDWSDHLVGKVKQELKFDKKTEQLFLNEFSQFIGRLNNFAEYRHSFGTKKLDTKNNNYGVQIASGWFVRQFENEYNPIHIHTGARMSCVGYLSLPDGIEKEWEKDYKDHHPANGHIQFVHGTPSGYSQTNFMIKPQVGDFYVFPAELFHCVYPFKTKGERLSFSVNFNFIEVPKEKVDK